MILIRPETAEDLTAIYRLNSLAFGGESEARLVDELRKSPSYSEELSLVAVADGKVIGHILFSLISIETQTGAVPALALAPMAVHPDWQRQGVGSELVRQGLARARNLGHKIVIVVGHPEYYPRFGFSSAREKHIEAPFPVPDEAFLVAELAEGALNGVTGIVKYPPAFGAV